MQSDTVIMNLHELLEKIERLCAILGGDRLVEVETAHISGVSTMTVGEAGLRFLQDLSKSGLRVKVFSTCNPISAPVDTVLDSAQREMLFMLKMLGVSTWTTCIPYEHVKVRSRRYYAWSESSAVAFINSVYDAYAEKFPGVLALVSAITGTAPRIGLMIPSRRIPQVLVKVRSPRPLTYTECGVLGKIIAEMFGDEIPYLPEAGTLFKSLEHVKSLLAAYATYSNNTFLVLEGVTRNYDEYRKMLSDHVSDKVSLDIDDIARAERDLGVIRDDDIGQFRCRSCIVVGCPHLGREALCGVVEMLCRQTVSGLPRTFVFTSRFAKHCIKHSCVSLDVVPDTCLFVSKYVDELSKDYEIILTNSVKQFTYLRKVLSEDKVFLIDSEMLEKVIAGTQQDNVHR